MFALWYLSLAFDEMRKRCGWIFFDIFTSKGPASSINASIDNKSTSPPTNDDDTKNNAPIEMSATLSSDKISNITSAAAQINNNNVNNIPKPAAEMIKSPKTVVDPMPMTMPVPIASASSIKDAEKKTSNGEMLTGIRSLNNVPSRSASASIVAPTSSEASLHNNQEGSQQAAAKPSTMFNDEQLMNNGIAEVPEKQPTVPPRSAVHNPTKTTIMSPKRPQPISPQQQQEQQQGNDGMHDGGRNSLQQGAFPMDHVVRRDAAAARTNDPKDEIKRFLASESVNTPSFSHEANVTNSLASNKMVDAAVIAKLEEGYAKLAASDSKSLLKKHLTKEIFDNLKNKKTPTFGSTLLDCIQSGLENHDSGVGIYAPDAEAYCVFSDLFDPIIEDYHGGFKKTDKHPPKDFGDVNVFKNVDPTNQYVISTRVRCGRSMQGYPFNPCLSEAQYKEMEQKVSTTLSGLEGELKGKFYPLTGMEKGVQQQLIDDHFLFKEGDRFLQAANACRFWPSGRGIYHNDNKTFLVWCNEEDHLRIISMQMGGDLGEVYRRLTTAVNDIEKRIPFSHDDRLGFLTFCPTNLGTTIRASVHIKVPKLAANKAKLEEVASKYNLQVRGTRGEHTEAEGGVYDISNKRRMGLTEFEAVKEMSDGITELIKLESSM